MLTIPSAPFSPPTPPAPEGVDLRPASAYEAVTRQKVESLAEDLKEIKGRLNTLFYTVIGAILIDLLTRWVVG